VLALDVGRRRIGLAGCDPLGLTVTPLRALARGSFASDLEHLNTLVQQRRVLALVVGLPLDAAGQPTAQALHCQRYGERHGLHGDRSGALDSAAAALLLEQWLQDGPDPVLPATIERSQTADAAAS
jgi:putative Holliday junction resolvase